MTIAGNTAKLDSTDVVGVDVDYTLFDLKEIFTSWYRYHNESCLVSFDEFSHIDPTTNRVITVPKTLSRFESFRRIQSGLLGAKPFLGGKGIPAYSANVNLNHAKMLLRYLRLPFKTLFSDNKFVKINLNRTLYEYTKKSKKALSEIEFQRRNNPSEFSNNEISDAVGDCFNDIINNTREIGKCHSTIPTKLVTDAFATLVHDNPDMSYRAFPVDALDLVTEPQCGWDTTEWGMFFILRKIPVSEAIRHIKKKTAFWNPEAIKNALEDSLNNRSVVNGNHGGMTRSLTGDTTSVAEENFAVKSYYQDKSTRMTTLSGYYGNLLVVEAYYLNKDDNVTKAVFFPSQDIPDPRVPAKNTKENDGINEREALFTKTIKVDSLHKIITVIPSDRSELSLERQRFFMHELHAPTEALLKTECAILNLSANMGILFLKDLNQSQSAEKVEDLDLSPQNGIIILGTRDFVEPPYKADLNHMLAVRSMLYQHIFSLCYLGGLDGTETTSSGRGAGLAHQRLVRDSRVHKYNIEDVADGLRDFYKNIFASILKITNDEVLLELPNNKILKYYFMSMLFDVMGYPKEYFEFDKDDILPDTGLPFWLDLQTIRSGGSHFGPAELVLYEMLNNTFGGVLDPEQSKTFARMAFKSVLGTQDALDILGNPKDAPITDADGQYWASVENAAIVGSVSTGAISFEPVLTNPGRDNDVVHLSVHNPLMQSIITKLNESDVTPEKLQELSEHELDTRTNLILRLAALANHAAPHITNLDRFSSTRTDINQIKEQTNALLQSAEGLLNNLQNYLRTLEAKRQDEALRLQNISPENEAEKMKQQTEMQKLQVTKAANDGKLAMANKLADQRQQQHIDKQVTKAKDRQLKAQMAEADHRNKEQDSMTQHFLKAKELDLQKYTVDKQAEVAVKTAAKRESSSAK